ncbi:hypothetical protein DNTS_033508 [Danionella cerebrum]|uniref:Uncharacterized protein n=1 Tax=Danionella cerebrum TaxID=2873325 RepID=A0A553PE60_9TELE|nr:hypothetical protein DNTS_033508 [Danionella translucida]
MILSIFCAKYMILLVCALESFSFARQEQTPIFDTDLRISSDFSSSTSDEGEGNGNIHRLSLSPWTSIPTFSPNRIPKDIFKAQCNSEYCIFPNEYLNSMPIYQDILVLKKEPGHRCFRTTFERVPVGCTCIRAKAS